MTGKPEENLGEQSPQQAVSAPSVTTPARRAENVPLAQGIEENKAKEEKAAEEGKKNIREAFSKAGGVEPRLEYSESVLEETLLSPIINLEKDWEKLRNDLYARSQNGENITVAELNAQTSEIEKQMQTTAKIISAYIFKMAEKTGGKLSPEALAEIINSVNKSAVKMAEIALLQKEAPALAEAMKLALKIERIDEKKVFEDLSKIILEGSSLCNYVWTVLSLMDAELQIRFGKFYIENNKLNPQDAQIFLEKWSVQGNISVETMKKILETSGTYTQEFEKKAEEFATNWRKKNDFMKAAKLMMQKSYGATNQAMEKLEPLNVLKFLGQVWSVGTIGLNLMTAMFYGGKLNDFDFILKQMMNPYVGVSTAILVGTSGVASGAPEEERKTAERVKAKQELKILTSKRNLEVFLTSNDFEGSKKFWEFLQDVRQKFGDEKTPFPENAMTKETFISWLKLKYSKANAQEKDKIIKVIAGLSDNGIADDQKITDEDLYRLSLPFSTFQIGGSRAQETYNNALKA